MPCQSPDQDDPGFFHAQRSRLAGHNAAANTKPGTGSK
jgi:hypothetical protein